jgi:DNA-binding SARP family transcriptional activator
MHVRVLGQIEAGANGRAYPIGGPTQRRVLASLIARRGEVVDVSQLVEVSWPTGVLPDRAEHNVRTYVHRLRTALRDVGGRIETVGTGYRMRIEPGELDADRFEQLASTAGRLIDTGDLAEAIATIDEATAMWHGRPYAEFADEPWAMPEAIRLTELRWAMSERRAEAALAAGRPEEAVSLLASMIREEPLRERPQALLMRALHESGRHAEALRAFHDFRRLLVDEIGVEPSSDLVALDRAIATGSITSTPARSRTVGNYELHERIGGGPLAVVHRATQTSLDREVAVKIVRAELANRPEFIRRFGAEAQMVAALEHPHVVPLYDYWREPDRAYLVMRWMAGGSLATRIDVPWALDATVALVDQIAAALDVAHARGIVHRDLKPANILFDADGRAYLGDFGIAMTVDECPTAQAAPWDGAPAFAAPEQLRHEPVGPMADVYSLAVVVVTLLTADDAGPPPIRAVRSLRPELPAGVDDVLAVAAALQPTERYPTAGAFAVALRAAASRTGPATPLAPLRPRMNPYKGLRPFDESDAADFHGRDRLVDELIDHLSRPGVRMLAVVGPSGSGKSSVVRAGVVPALRAGGVAGSTRWYITAMMPGGRPYEALETALLRVAVNPPASLLDQLRDGDRGIVRAARRILPDDDGVVVVVIDQFEELFAGAARDRDAESFLRALAVAATDPRSPIRLLLTLRADFYDRPLRHLEFAPLLKEHTVVVTPLDRDELEHAITTPAATVGVGFEPGLVTEIVADVDREPGALPLLQYALTQTFDAAEDGTMTIETYRSIGGLTGALARRADDLWQAADQREQLAIRHVFGRLVSLGEGTEDTRRRARCAELGDDAATTAVLERFGGARLVTFDRDPATREPTAEIAHEALIREWPRLRDWLDDDRDTLRTHRHLTVAAQAWRERDRDPNELYRGARLDNAEPLLGSGLLNTTESEFLDASLTHRDAERDAERRRVRRLRRLVGVTAFVAAIAFVAGLATLVQWRRANDRAVEASASAAAAERARSEADRHAVEAQAERDAADVLRLRSEALALMDRLPVPAVLLAVEADRIEPSLASKDALHRTLTSPNLTRFMEENPFDQVRLGALGSLEEILPLPDVQIEMLAQPAARLHLSIRRDGDELLTSVSTPRLVSTVIRHSRVSDGWASTDTGERALIAGSGDHALWVANEIVVLDRDDQPVGRPIPRPTDLVAFELSQDGRTIVLARAGGLIEIYDRDGTLLGSFELPDATRPEAEPQITIASDGSRLAVQVDGERVDGVWGYATVEPVRLVASGRTNTTLDYLTNRLQRPFVLGDEVFVSPPQTNYLVPMDVALMETTGGALLGHRSVITDVAVDDDHGLVATASLDGTVRVWDAASAQQLGREIDAAGAEIWFDARGRLIVLVGDRVSIWDYDVSAWPEIACRVALRNLSRDEWDRHGPNTIGYRKTCPQYSIES